MVDVALGEHGVVLEGGLAEGGAVGGDEDELGLIGAEVLEGGLVAEGRLSGLHDELEPGVGVLRVLLGFLLKQGSERVKRTGLVVGVVKETDCAVHLELTSDYYKRPQ